MEILKWHHEALAARTVEALKKHEFDAAYFPEKEKAAEFVMGFISSGAKVGFGGSVTIAGLGLPEKIRESGAVILNHNEPGLSAERKIEIRREQLLCDVFLTSTNAVTLDGCLVNVDGNGNRTNAMTFGPRKVVVVAGTNKIRKNIDEAMERIEHFAAPMNNKRIGTQNPCTVTGTCSDCGTKTRICRVYSILKRRPAATDITVVIVGDGLGF